MNDDSSNEATNQPISLNNEYTLDAVVYDRAAPSYTTRTGVATTFTIVPDAPGGGGLDNALGIEFGYRNIFFFSLFPGLILNHYTREQGQQENISITKFKPQGIDQPPPHAHQGQW